MGVYETGDWIKEDLYKVCGLHSHEMRAKPASPMNHLWSAMIRSSLEVPLVVACHQIQGSRSVSRAVMAGS